MNKLIRLGIVSLDILPTLEDFIGGSRKNNKYKIINGVSVKITSQRYAVFKKSITCCKCGVVGQYFAIEKPFDSIHAHLNLYAIKNGKEILMTKDHIFPRSKGGKNYLSNYQTMCEVCNKQKADKIEE